MSYSPIPVGQQLSSNSVPINLPYGVIDEFGKLQVGVAFNDIDCQFFRDDPNAILSITTANGGTATQTVGMAQFASSTATSGAVTGESLDKVSYHPGAEIYALFTAAFLDGGLTAANQYVGYYDANNGFFIGYTGTSFGVTVRNGASDTTVAKASWNVDTLEGTAGSKFTRNGTPEAINLALLNVFRIRFGWLGVAPVNFEVLSPDGEWVLFHQIKQPNLAASPHIQNADLPMRLEIVKTAAGATNLRVNTACWGAGCTTTQHETADTATLGTAVNSSIVQYTKGLNTARIYIGTTTTGTIIFEATIDGKNWFTCPTVIDRNLDSSDLLVTGAVTPTSGNLYTIGLTGLRAFRVRTATTLGTTVAVATHLTTGELMVNVVSNANAPHNIGRAIVHKNAEYSTTQTGTAFWTPASGKKFVVTDFTISTGGTTAGIVTLWQGASGDTTYTAGTDPVVFRGEFSPSANAKPGITKTYNVPFVASTADHVLRVTTSAAMTVYIQVNGYEIP